LDKKEKESVLSFHGKELLGDMTYMDIERICGRDVLQYRTIYAFFELNEGKAKIDTAARIALAMGTSLNALYSPKGSSWATTDTVPAITEEKTDSDSRIIFSHLSKETLSELSLVLMRSGHDALGELCNQYALGLNADNPAESEGAQDE